MSEAGFDLAEIDRLLSTTRAVRRRLDLSRPVPRELLLDCIRLSQQAPTGTNAQHWRWVVVDEPDQRRRLAELYARGIPLLEESAKSARDAQTKTVYDHARDFASRIGEVPVLVVPCLEGRLPPDAPSVVVTTYYGSIYQAVWSFQLALRSRGLGSLFTTMHLAFEDEAREVLGLPPDVVQTAMLPVAWTVGTDFRPARRPPPETITHWNRWQG
ncbi:MAG: nitroreductase family protein [Spirochaetaceae bacterium]|nr:nitroreductase family protein [Myxococcales bacterium]MCB9722696.1 nitroreductase family protein [Spirochaetaceae bacterium]HPG27733.1 nitroreductase family protein [Myxococcota bacterium]